MINNKVIDRNFLNEQIGLTSYNLGECSKDETKKLLKKSEKTSVL